MASKSCENGSVRYYVRKWRSCGTGNGWTTIHPHRLPGATATTISSRESILSPYRYKAAKEHYEALMAAAKAHGGPTIYTKATVPDWTAIISVTPRPIMAPNGSGESAKHQLYFPCSPWSVKSEASIAKRYFTIRTPSLRQSVGWDKTQQWFGYQART